MDLIDLYEKRYSKKNIYLYPTEFVVRWLKGNYPNWKFPKHHRKGKCLDLGFGDGRNLELLLQCGFEVYGVEISNRIIESMLKNTGGSFIAKNFRVGENAHIPFPDKFFDVVIACHSIYYLRDEHTLKNNLEEVGRCICDNGLFLFSIPTKDSYLIKNSTTVDSNHVVVRDDPLGLRNGVKLAFASSKEDVLELTGNFFEEISIGKCSNDWWGIAEDCWVVSCRRKA